MPEVLLRKFDHKKHHIITYVLAKGYEDGPYADVREDIKEYIYRNLYKTEPVSAITLENGMIEYMFETVTRF